MGAPQGIENAPANKFHEFTSVSGSETDISREMFNFPNFQISTFHPNSAATNSFFDLAAAFESDVLGLDGKNTERSNEFTHFENVDFERVARIKTIFATQAANHPGVGITLETTALRVTWNDTWARRKALISRQRANFVILEA